MKSIFSLRPGILDREEDEDQRDEPPRPRKERGARIEGEGAMTELSGLMDHASHRVKQKLL